MQDFFLFFGKNKKLRTKLKKNSQQSRIFIAENRKFKTFFVFWQKLKIVYKNKEK